jgi:hypothetical protein
MGAEKMRIFGYTLRFELGQVPPKIPRCGLAVVDQRLSYSEKTQFPRELREKPS